MKKPNLIEHEGKKYRKLFHGETFKSNDICRRDGGYISKMGRSFLGKVVNPSDDGYLPEGYYYRETE